MSQIFVSYASEDRPRVAPLVRVLEEHGWRVWWDRKLETGGTFDSDIEKAVDASSCILVVWSAHSVESRWVRAEAHEGLEREILVPVAIDDVRPPLVFRQVQTAQLHGWPEAQPADPLRQMLASITHLIGGGEQGEVVSAEAPVVEHSHERSLAVLPFRSMSADPEDGYFAEGLAEQILDGLARLPDLRVTPRTSSFAVPASGVDAASIGTQLHVNYLLEGSVRRARDAIRVTVRLTRTLDGYSIWNRTYDREAGDVFAIQDAISERVASALKSAFREQAVRLDARGRTRNLEAFDEYLTALHYDREMHRGGTEAVEQIREHCERALELDPEYLPALVLLADTYLNRMGYRMSLDEVRPRARAILERAVALDPDDPALRLRLAELRRLGGDSTGALVLYEEAWHAAPDDVHNDYATTLFTVGRLDDAIRVLKHNLERDPENFSIWFYLGAAHYGNRDTRAALAAYEKSLAIVAGGFLADGVRATIAGTLILAGDDVRAREVLEECLRSTAEQIELETGLIACIQAMLGDAAPGRAILADFQARAERGHLDPQGPFWAALGVEDHDAALRWLGRIVEEDAFPSVYFLTSWPMLDPLRADERFDAALRSKGLVA